MSDRNAPDGHNSRLLRALIWAGVGLAPIAALMVLVAGGDGPERLGVLLIAVSVVLLGAALLIRHDPVLLRMHVEDRVADEVNALRDELRGEIAAAARVAAPVRRTATGGRASAAASASVVGAAAHVPGQRGRAAVSPPPPMAPVFRPPPLPPARDPARRGAPPHRPDDERTYRARPGQFAEQGGRRRADVTAVDFGYTGRRARPDHTDDHFGYGPDQFGYGDPEPGYPGYPGWTEADERYGPDRTGGW